MTKAPLTTSNSTAMRVLAAASILMLVVAAVAGMAALLGNTGGLGWLLVMAVAAAAAVAHAGAIDELRAWFTRRVGAALPPLCSAAVLGLPPLSLSLSRTRPALRAADAAAPAAAAVGGLAPADARPPRLSL